MGWLKLDDRFPGHRKVRRLTDREFRLHVTALARCAADETDGYLTDEDLDECALLARIPAKQVAPTVRVLVEQRHLWHALDIAPAEHPDARWQIHDYLDHNPSHAELVANREATRKRVAEYRRRNKAERDIPDGEPPEDDDPGNGVSNASRTPGVTLPQPSPTQPNPTQPSKSPGSPSSSPREPARLGSVVASLDLHRRRTTTTDTDG